MQGHDAVREISEILGDTEIAKKLSPKFNELSLDIQEIASQSKNPMFIAVLLYKLTEERRKTNELLEKIYDKFDQIMLKLKTENSALAEMELKKQPSQQSPLLEVLPEQDQMILHLAKDRGQITAEDVRCELGYRGKNAASQRLNKLFKEGHLRKMQSGRKVLYLARII